MTFLSDTWPSCHPTVSKPKGK